MPNPLAIGCGTSRDADAAAAGAAAAQAACAELDGETPALVLCFASIGYDLEALLRAIRDVTGSAPLAGATTCGSYLDGVTTPPGTGVSVLALGGGRYRFGTAAVTGLGAAAEDAGWRLARAARAAAGPAAGEHAALLLLSDGLNPDQQGLVSGIYRAAGAGVPVVGGAAADDRRLARTLVLHDDRVLDDGAVAVWIAGDEPFHVVAEHGWHATSLPMVATRLDGNVVRELGGRPAAEVFLEHVSASARTMPLGKLPEDWYSSHAFGLIEPDGSHLVRGCVIDADGCLRTFAPLPPYAAVEIVSCRTDELLDATERVVARAVDGRDASLVLCFSCVARLDLLGDERAGEEAERLHEAAAGLRTFGFYTYGEFARAAGVAGFHNATIAAIAL